MEESFAALGVSVYFVFLSAFLLGIFVTIHSFRLIKLSHAKSKLAYVLLLSALCTLILCCLYKLFFIYPHGDSYSIIDVSFLHIYVGIIGSSFGLASYLAALVFKKFMTNGEKFKSNI